VFRDKFIRENLSPKSLPPNASIGGLNRGGGSGVVAWVGFIKRKSDISRSFNG